MDRSGASFFARAASLAFLGALSLGCRAAVEPEGVECKTVEVRRPRELEECHTRCTERGCHERCEEHARHARERHCWVD